MSNDKVNRPGGKGSRRRGGNENENKFKQGYAGIKWGRDTDVAGTSEEAHLDGSDMSEVDTGKQGNA